jgi:hypothetical protein
VTKKVPFLRRPIQIDIEGKSFDFVTIGYVARALARTPTTIKICEKYGLFPSAPYLLNSKDISARRRHRWHNGSSDHHWIEGGDHLLRRKDTEVAQIVRDWLTAL